MADGGVEVEHLTCPHCGERADLVRAKAAAQILGVTSSNFRSLTGLPEPVMRSSSGDRWWLDDIVRYRKLRDSAPRGSDGRRLVAAEVNPREPARCPHHGDEDMRPRSSGRMYCAVCSRQRMANYRKDQSET